jgi:hypothetical protein
MDDEPTDIHAAAEERRRPGDGRQSFGGLMIALSSAVATAIVGIAIWYLLLS